VEEAARLGLRALALTDHNGLYGAVRFAEAAAELDVRTIFAELSLGSEAPPRTRTARPAHLLVLARGPEGYRRLSRQLAAAHLAGGEKGKLRYDFDALTEAAGGHWHILTGCRKGAVRQALCDGGLESAERALADLVDRFTASRVSIELTHHGQPLDDDATLALARLAPRFGVGVVAPPERISPIRRAPGWRWRWAPSGPGSPLIRPPGGWLHWVAHTCGPVRRWPGCSRNGPKW